MYPHPRRKMLREMLEFLKTLIVHAQEMAQESAVMLNHTLTWVHVSGESLIGIRCSSPWWCHQWTCWTPAKHSQKWWRDLADWSKELCRNRSNLLQTEMAKCSQAADLLKWGLRCQGGCLRRLQVFKAFMKLWGNRNGESILWIGGNEKFKYAPSSMFDFILSLSTYLSFLKLLIIKLWNHRRHLMNIPHVFWVIMVCVYHLVI